MAKTQGHTGARAGHRTAAAGAVALGLVLGLGGWLEPSAAEAARRSAPPPAPVVRTVDLHRPVSAAAARTAVLLPARFTAPFSLAGVTWADPAIRLPMTIELRTRAAATGHWSPWRDLEADPHSGAEAGAAAAAPTRGSTDPLWVGPSDAVQVRLGPPSGVTPPGLRLELVDPGRATAGADLPPVEAVPDPPGAGLSGGPAAPRAESGATGVPRRPPPVPRVISRAGWGADESLNRAEPDYADQVKAVFVHHTAGDNGYRCADSPAILRSIHAYHVRSRGWNDIGYNFLVDRCGTVFEGRRGGVRWPVIGAHTHGFNTGTAGIAVLGSYGSTGTTPVVRRAIAQIAAYKLGSSGHDPAGRVTLVAGVDGKFRKGQRVTFNRVSGHRDAVGTECPGTALYRQLPDIRRQASGPVTGLALTGLTGGTAAGSAYHVRGPVRVGWRVATPTALLSSFEIVVNGVRVATTPPAHRTALVPLRQGRHTVQVRAVHLAGRTAVTPGRTVIADRTPPAFVRPPAVALRTGPVSAKAVPVRLGWQVTDARGIRTVTLSAPGRVAVTPETVRWATTVPAGRTNRWSVRATDPAGNSRSAAVTHTAGLVSEAQAIRTSTWWRLRHAAYLGGGALRAQAPGATLTWTVTGRAAAVIASRTPSSGRLRIHVDGVLAATVDLGATGTVHRQAVWTGYWAEGGTRTVRVEVIGTAGRQGATVDGLARLS